jgi:HEAT repeat protein
MAANSPIGEAPSDSLERLPERKAGRAEETGRPIQHSARVYTLEERKKKRRIAGLAEEDRSCLHSAAIAAMASEEGSSGHCDLVGLLMEALCDPSLSRAQAVALGRTAMTIDPMTDVALAKFLAGREPAEGALDAKELARLMEVLAEIAGGARVLPFLQRMARHPNAHVRSRAVLTIGRFAPTPNVARDRFAEAGPRVRANMIEAVGEADREDARALLLAAAEDRNNRVAGNALLALYRLGDASAEPALRKMAEHETYLFRATCAWVLGEIADPRFAGILARMVGDSEQPVRKRAFAALGKIAAARKAGGGGAKTTGQDRTPVGRMQKN